MIDLEIEAEFQEIMRSRSGCAVVFAGSGSDKEHIDKVVESLEAYGIPHEVRICSAHKQPGPLRDLIEVYNNVGGAAAYIGIAGGVDALSGVLSFHALNPVISCPPDGLNPSCLNNPRDSSNAFIKRPDNVGRFVAQMYANANQDLAHRLLNKTNDKLAELEQSDEQFRKEYGERQNG
tara:strand:- start:496 stop:1029 length:534 start_codon:yes stop_codon:yes gene_type:complete